MDQLLQGGIQAVREKKYDLAIEKGNEAISFSPDTAQGHYVVSIGYAAQGMTTEALEAVNTAAGIDPENFQKVIAQIHVMALGAQANQAERKSDFDGAISNYEAILEIAPDDPNAYYNMALAYGHKSDFDQALKSIDKAIAMKPGDAEFQQMKIRLQGLYLKSMDEKLKIE